MLSRNNDFYFYLGAVLSLSLFLLFGFAFVLFIMQQSRIKQIQLSSSNYIAVNLNTVPTAPPVKIDKSEPPKETESEKTLETVETPAAKPNTDLASLFGKVETKKLVKRSKTDKPVVDEKFLKKIQKRIETKDTKKAASSQASSLVKNLSLSKEQVRVVGDSSGVVDEYLAKIHAEIYTKFFPPAESVGKVAKVRLEIDAYGTLVSFRVIRYSHDELFDEAVDTCLKALRQFPAHPDNKPISLDIILTMKE
ncbi:MAG: TonB C-terminal domain-containing protein [Campylobacterales bacterium]|nr:TonB C-terminal domain-containing protein [Campylobacterales bacterium]